MDKSNKRKAKYDDRTLALTAVCVYNNNYNFVRYYRYEQRHLVKMSTKNLLILLNDDSYSSELF